MDGLFIGDRDAAEELKFFMENKITRVINCSAQSLDDYWEPVGINYLNYGWSDNDFCTILDDRDAVINECYDFIEEALDQGEGVLVQSFRAQSRSCCVLAAYLMKKYKWDLQATLEYIYFRCPALNVNDGFLNQLETFEQRLEDARCHEADSDDSSWDGNTLQNTLTNCQRPALSDVQIGKKTPSSRRQRILFSEHIAEVKPYNVGSVLEEASQDDSPKAEKSKVGKPVLKSVLKSGMKTQPMSNGRHETNGGLAMNGGNNVAIGTIIIHTKKSGPVSCNPDEIVPQRFGVQISSKTIFLEYEVPRYGLRAHHSISVDFEGPKVPDHRASKAEEIAGDIQLANKLVEQHRPWLAGVSVEQIANLVGHVRTGKMKRDPQQGVSRAPGRSPR